MKILIDIGHPAHVHLFKNFALEMIAKGNYVLFTVRDKEHERYLLDINGFRYKSLGKHYNSIPGKILGLFIFNLKVSLVAMKIVSVFHDKFANAQ